MGCEGKVEVVKVGKGEDEDENEDERAFLFPDAAAGEAGQSG